MSTSDGIVRIRSDYIGAGNYVVQPDEQSVAVNTTYGVQSVGYDSQARWQVDLGERCLGIARRSDGVLLANTVHAIHQLEPDGALIGTSRTRHEVASGPVPWKDSMLLVTLTRIYALDQNSKTIWAYRFRESLGDSVRAVLVVDVHPMEGGVLVGAVDYNSGLGRVIFLDELGKLSWQSDLGPLTSVFPVGDNEFVYTLTGYGRFESYRCDTSGDIKWNRSTGGPGIPLEDGSMAMLVGSNESPTWDNCKFSIADEFGVDLVSREAKGRACFPPVQGADENFYFSSFFQPIDPSESRIDYTSYVTHPSFLAFDFLMRVKSAPHQYNVYYFRATPGGDIEPIFEDSASFSLGPPMVTEDTVFLVHNRDVLAVRVNA